MRGEGKNPRGTAATAEAESGQRRQPPISDEVGGSVLRQDRGVCTYVCLCQSVCDGHADVIEPASSARVRKKRSCQDDNGQWGMCVCRVANRRNTFCGSAAHASRTLVLTFQMRRRRPGHLHFVCKCFFSGALRLRFIYYIIYNSSSKSLQNTLMRDSLIFAIDLFRRTGARGH